MNVIVTAGPTREFLDPVRFLSNRSTGKMGFAVAEAFAARGHDVLLVTGPVTIEPPDGVRCIRVVSADEMYKAVKAEFEPCNALVMAAAVADWTPESASDVKLKKSGGTMTLNMVRTQDILSELSRIKGDRILAGFAAETGDPLAEGERKLKEKGLDVLFANDVSAPDSGFEVDTNRIICIDASGAKVEWALMSKSEAGQKIAEAVECLHGEMDA